MILKKRGRDLYNNSITRKMVNQEKASVYFQQLEEKVEKQAELGKVEKIKEFLVYLECMGKEDNLTNERMRSTLYKWKTQGYYLGTLNIRYRKEFIEIFWDLMLNAGFIEFE